MQAVFNGPWKIPAAKHLKSCFCHPLGSIFLLLQGLLMIKLGRGKKEICAFNFLFLWLAGTPTNHWITSDLFSPVLTKRAERGGFWRFIRHLEPIQCHGNTSSGEIRHNTDLGKTDAKPQKKKNQTNYHNGRRAVSAALTPARNWAKQSWYIFHFLILLHTWTMLYKHT